MHFIQNYLFPFKLADLIQVRLEEVSRSQVKIQFCECVNFRQLPNNTFPQLPYSSLSRWHVLSTSRFCHFSTLLLVSCFHTSPSASHNDMFDTSFHPVRAFHGTPFLLFPPITTGQFWWHPTCLSSVISMKIMKIVATTLPSSQFPLTYYITYQYIFYYLVRD